METMETQFENIVVEQIGAARVIGLNRPRKLNALCAPLFVELNRALAQAENDDAARVVVVIGGAGAGEKAFAAGADIAEMAQIESFAEAARRDCAGELWEQITRCNKSVVAAVGGLALGGGCELAMMCDIVIAAEDAKFGHPEIALGTMPGAGGAQRLARAIGKAKTMDMCLTGRTLDAAEAETRGLGGAGRAARAVARGGVGGGGKNWIVLDAGGANDKRIGQSRVRDDFARRRFVRSPPVSFDFRARRSAKREWTPFCKNARPFP